MNDKVTVVGWCYGTFVQERTGEQVKYCNLFVEFPFAPGRPGSDYNHEGEKCATHKVVDSSCLRGLEVGDTVILQFNQYQKVIGYIKV